ncbi:TraB/GumN family protein [Neorhodopirellula pilleata]
MVFFWQVSSASPVSAQSGTESPVQDQAADQSATDQAESTVDAPLYVRVLRGENDEPLALQTAIVRYVGKPKTEFAGKIVDLIGVVHIGQAEYYTELDKRLGTYDKVLYELVAPDGTRIRPEDLQQRRSLLASVQTGMKDMLNLEYQLEKIDYMAKNFRHADMSPEEFSEDLESRGDSVWKMLARMMGAGIATQSKNGGEAGILMALFSKDRSKLMKRAMAGQLVDIEMVSAGLNDADGENTLIKGRNRKAFEILRDELQQGSQTVGVFYGAGHLPDMAERLQEQFDMEPTTTDWLDAWDLTRN